jgi:MATE family multidrug resistance protein
MNHLPLSLRAELKDTFKLAGPIVLTQVGHMSMGLVDTLVAGRISTDALAGLGMAANFYWTFTSVCVACLYSLDTFFSQAVGAKQEDVLRRFLGQAFWSSAILTLLAALTVLASHLVYLHFASPGPVRAAFASYIHWIIWCLPGLFVYAVLQRYWQARHIVLPFTIIIVFANVLNLAACFALGLGMWGFPRLEVKGIAIATVCCRYFMLAAAVAFTWWIYRRESFRLPRLDLSIQRQILKLGLPAAGHTGLEIGAFAIATIIVGAFGAVSLAAHHISLMLASFTFMFPLGFSSAAAVRVGVHIGAGRPDKARVAGWICIILSVSVMSLFALSYLVAPRAMLGWFSKDPAVLDVGVKILAIVAIFQIGDGIQVSTAGALRGAGNTRAAMFANLIGHYPIGLVLGLIFAFWLGYGVVGMWVGLAAGLFSVAVLLLRVWSATSRDPEKLKPIQTTR